MMEIAGAMFWLLILLCLVIGGFFGVMWIRKSLRDSGSTSAPQPFTLGDLRQMRRTGQITDEEFERLKAQIIASLKPPTKPAPPPKELPPPQPPAEP